MAILFLQIIKFKIYATVRAGNVIGGGDYSKDRLIKNKLNKLKKIKKLF